MYRIKSKCNEFSNGTVVFVYLLFLFGAWVQDIVVRLEKPLTLLHFYTPLDSYRNKSVKSQSKFASFTPVLSNNDSVDRTGRAKLLHIFSRYLPLPLSS